VLDQALPYGGAEALAVLITGGARSGKSRFAEKYAAHIGSRGIYIATCQPYDEEMKERIGRHQLQREEEGFSWTTIEEPLQVSRLLDELSDQLANEVKELLARQEKPPVVLLDCLTLWLTNQMLLLEDGIEENLDSGVQQFENQQIEYQPACQSDGKLHKHPKTEELKTEDPKTVEPKTKKTKSGEGRRLQEEMEKLAQAIERYPFPLVIVTNEVGDSIVPAYALGRAFRDEAGRLNQAVAASSSRVFLVTAGIPVDLKALAFKLEDF
jgi:adenosylcobinamide kinase/adenosylcobinamide-phosphate guanylyltransferase